MFVGGEDTDGVGGADLDGWTTVYVPPDIVDGGNPGAFLILRYGNPEAAGKTMPVNPYAGVAYTISVDEDLPISLEARSPCALPLRRT